MVVHFTDPASDYVLLLEAHGGVVSEDEARDPHAFDKPYSKP